LDTANNTLTPRPAPHLADLRIAEVLAQSGFFSDATSAAKAMAKIICGRELGIGPMISMSNVYIIKGKITLSAGLQAALLKASDRYGYRILTATDTEAKIEFVEWGQPLGTASFTIEEARHAGLANKDNWRCYPADMLFARALTRGIRRFCPDLLMGGAYTPEEIIGTSSEELPHKVGRADEDKPIITENKPIITENKATTENKTVITSDGMGTSSAGKATVEQLKALKEHKDYLQIDAEAWKKILSKRGAEKAHDLTITQASELIKALAHRVATKQLADGLAEADQTEIPITNEPTEGGAAPAAETKSTTA
jgi:hypothetical protein